MTIVLAVAVVALAITAQVYRIQRNYFADEVVKQYAWIDEIIDELEEKAEDE